jgi:hypothetical protein
MLRTVPIRLMPAKCTAVMLRESFSFLDSSGTKQPRSTNRNCILSKGDPRSPTTKRSAAATALLCSQ